MFELEGVNYRNILRYPDMTIPEGVTTCISGESGSGKSTLLKLLNGVISPTEGAVRYAGRAVENYDPILLRREVLLVSQSVYLFDKSIQDNFNAYYAYREMEPPSEAEMMRYLDICSVHLPLSSMCQVLSGGERQRVFIAINLSYGARVLMLDEPTSALDDKNAAALMENVKGYCKENRMTLLLVSHDKTIAERYADTMLVLPGGAGQ